MSLQFFVADDGSDGQELWVTNGQTGGTFQLKDINPGLGNANIGNLVQSNGIMYFTAYDGSAYHLWRSDGTTAGTYALTSSANGDNTANLVNVNGRLFFTGSDSVHGAGLFVTDGTAGGTQFVQAISSASQFFAVGGSLFFTAYDPVNGTELWKSDGTAAGTGLVKDILPGGGGSSYGNFTALDGKLYFTANDATHGSEVWVSDGTAAGTFQIKDINNGTNGSGAGNFFAAAGHVFFTANDGAHGTQFWSTDGTAGNATLLTLSGGQSPTPRSGTQITFNHAYYFIGSDPAGGSAIYTSDGTTLTKVSHLSGFSGQFFNLGGKLVFQGNDGSSGDGLYTFDGASLAFVSAVPGGFNQPVVSNGKLFFVSYDSAHGSELWVSDGTAAGTHITADLNPGVYDANIGNISAVGNGVAFTAFRPDVGTEVFFSDGTAGGTGLLANANPTANHNPSLGFGSNVYQAGSLAFFAANDGVNGNELWVTDGSTGGSHMVSDMVFGGAGANPQNFYTTGSTIFFTADDGPDGRQLYTSDGTSVTQLTTADFAQPYNDASRFFTLGGKFYYMAYDVGGGFALFSSDGTTSGTRRVGHFGYDTPLHVGAGMILRGDDGTHGSGLYSFDGNGVPSFIAAVGYYENPVVSGGNLFWRSYDGGKGSELWVTDGTTAHMVQDINPGVYDSYPDHIVGLGDGSVVFTAFNPATGNEVYVSDGTSGGTHLLSDVNPTGNHNQSLNFNSNIYTAGGLSFFAGEDGIHGNELWVSDGTTGQTHMVTDMVVGGSGANPQNFYVANGKIFFTADDGVNGRQLYTSDGTTVTQLTTADVDQPYNDASRFFTLGGKLYFMAYDPAGGWNLYGTDGSVANTTRVGHFGYDTPLHVGSGMILRGDDGTHGSGLYSFDGNGVPSFIAAVSDYENPVVSGGNLFWRSYDGGNGSELWVTDGTTAHMVKDINPGAYDASPSNIVGLGNGSVVFTAFNPATGNEVYVSDGTSGGTHLLSDVNPTGNHNQSLNFNSDVYAAGSQSFFAAEDGIHGNELWVTDGTTGNSHMVTDLVVGGSSSNPQNFYVVGGKIFFTADDGVNGRQLYTSDGATVTQLTSNDLDTPYNDGARFFTINGQFFYLGYDSAANGGGYGIFTSDGTVSGTQRVYHFPSGNAYSVPVHLGANVVFYANDGTHGTGLYSFDGIHDPALIANVNDYENITVSGGNLFWRSSDGANGSELWVTDGTTAHMVQDINPGGGWSYPDQITSLGNGSVVFTADDGTNGREIWVSNGQSSGTFMLSDLFPGGTSSPGGLIHVGSQVFFTANYFSNTDGAHGTELFVTDGTSAGTKLVHEITPGSDGTSFGAFFAFGGKLYFTAYDGANGGWRTFVTDGSDNGTHLITPANGSTGYAGNFMAADATHFFFTGDSGLFYSDGTDAGTIAIGSSRGFDPNSATYTNGHLLYRLYDDANGYELWSTDGTAGSTHRVTDTLIPNSSNATGFTFSGGKVYFFADDGVHGGNELFVTGGTPETTHLLNDMNGAGGTSYGATFAFGGKLYFAAYDGDNGGWHTYVTDGNTVTRITPGDGSSPGNAGNFLKADATHFFFTGDNGLFYSDGTDAGTVAIGSSRGFDPNNASYNNGHLLYRLYDDTNGYELWSTDGTAGSTHRVTDTLIPNSSNATGFTFSGGKIYFFANDGVHGANELFVTDGTTTTLLNDFNGTDGTNYVATFAFGGKFYFTAYDGATGGYHTYVTAGTTVSLITPASGTTGYAGNFLAADATHFFFTGDSGLFYSDGTDAGTHLVGDTRGYDHASVVNGVLYYQHYDDTNGYELWKSDGTVAGTSRLTDTSTPNSSNPGSFAAIDNSPPTVTNADVSAITDQQTNHPFQNVVIGDSDLPAQTLTVTITPDDPAKGQFTVASLTASGFVAGGVNGSYTFTGTAAQATAAIDALIYQPTANRLVVGDSETMNFTIAVNDGAGGSVVNHQTVITQTSVNDAPIGGNDSAAVNEDASTGISNAAAGLLANDHDADVGETATLKISGAHFGAVADTAVAASGKTTIHGTYGDLHIAADGTYDYTPNTAAAEALPQGQTASDVFSYTVSDVHGAGGTATLTFNITGQEDGPAAVADIRSTFEDATSSSITRSGGLLGNDTDVDTGETATLAIAGAHFGAVADTAVAASGKTTIHGLYGDLHVAADGTYDYTPNTAAAEALPQGQTASDVFSYTITDAQGQTSTSSVTFNIAGTNDAPVGVNDSRSVNEDAPSNANAAAGVLANDSDVDTGETATLKVTGAHFGAVADTAVAASGNTTIHGLYGDLLIAADGSYSYTPNTAAAEALSFGQAASDVFSYTVSDVHGAGGTATLTFNITGQEDGPVAVADTRSVLEDATSSSITRSGGLLGNDTDVDTGETATLTITGAHFGVAADTAVASSGNTTIHGTYGDLVLAADGTYGYSPNDAAAQALPLGQAASDVFSYTITDAQGQTATSSVTFNITGTNDAPIGSNDSAAVNEDAPASAATRAAGVLANDTDIDTGETATLNVSGAHFGAAADTVVAASGKTTIHGTYGDLHIAADGTYDYTPDTAAAEALSQGQAASDVFNYTVADANGGSGTATLTFNITGQNDAPGGTIANGLAATEQVPLSLKGGITIGDVDGGGTVETVTLTAGYGVLHLEAGSSGASITANDAASVTVSGTLAQLNALFGNDATSVVQYTADTDTPPSSTTLSVTATDSLGAHTTTSGTIAITPVDDAAVAANDFNNVVANAAITGASVFGNDHDVDGPALQVGAVNGQSASVGTQIALASGALLTMRADGTYDYNPNHAFDDLTAATGAANSSRTDSFTYSLVNGNTATVTVTVTGDPNSIQPALGTAGADTITGTAHGDQFYLQQGGSDIASGAGGNDDFYMGAAWDAGDRLDGGAGTLDQVIVQGNYAGLTLGANSLTGIEQLVFLPGSDTRYGDVSGALYSYDITTDNGNVAAGQQLAVQAGTLRAGEDLTFDGSAESDGTFLIQSGAGEDRLTGGQLGDTLYGGGGNDRLDGGLGADTMNGGTGDDTYVVDNAGDVVVENAGEGNDTVLAGVSYTLSANVENLTLGGTANIDATGTTDANVLTGNSGNNYLVGNGGADTLIGGLGDDTYVVSDSATVIVEHAGEGNDTIKASVSYVLGAGVDVETTRLIGTDNFDLTGNADHQILIGNAGNNVIDGGGGGDRMKGAGGDDTYIVRSGSDVIVEVAGNGNDTVKAAVSYTLAAGVDIEHLVTIDATATTAIDLTGNEISHDIEGNAGVNVLTGGSGNDFLSGGGGADTLIGGLGDDTYAVSDSATVIVEHAGEGNDTIKASVSYVLGAGVDVETTRLVGSADLNLTGNADHQILIGNAGNNVIDGGGGGDRMKGAGGDDTYIVRSGSDVIVEIAGNGNDTVKAAVSYTLAAGVDIEHLLTIDATATTAIDLTGNDLSHDIQGNAGANVLTGGSGDDVLQGFAGNDALFGGGGADRFVFDHGTGQDVVGDFVSGTDKLDLSAFGFADFSSVQAATHDVGGNAVIDLGGGDSVTLTGFLSAQLQSGDVILSSSGQAPLSLGTAIVQDGTDQSVHTATAHFVDYASPISLQAHEYLL